LSCWQCRWCHHKISCVVSPLSWTITLTNVLMFYRFFIIFVS
jgi:hypothetical protein